MPYIKREQRAQYQESIDRLAELMPNDRMERPGHMNYVFSLLIERVYGKEMRYADHNEALGLLSAVSLELYRRKTAPYEDSKIEEQGDLTDL